MEDLGLRDEDLRLTPRREVWSDRSACGPQPKTACGPGGGKEF